MKARVKATGEIVEVIRRIVQGRDYLEYVWYYRAEDRYFKEYELEFATNDIPDNTDYWEKLKHQYAGMAMQGILNNNDLLTALCEGNKEVPISKIVSDNADIIATTLVNRLKNEEK